MICLQLACVCGPTHFILAKCVQALPMKIGAKNILGGLFIANTSKSLNFLKLNVCGKVFATDYTVFTILPAPYSW